MTYKNLSFGDALELVKMGKLVSRAGWNGKGMFIFMRRGDSISTEAIFRIKTLPESVKNWIDRNIHDHTKSPDDTGFPEVKFTPYLCMKAADNTIVNGWLASQTDMLAEDWMEVEENSIVRKETTLAS